MTSRRTSLLPFSVVRASPPPVRATDAAPVVLIGTMGAANQRQYDDLRRSHFPPERNYLNAHITLFHHLPPSLLPELCDLMRQLAAQNRAPRAEVTGVIDLGQGTAFRLRSPELLEMRVYIADHFHGMLSQQDRSTPRLHITVQNKVTHKAAIALQQQLAEIFQPHPLEIRGLAAHHYRGGPWEEAFAIGFRRKAAQR